MLMEELCGVYLIEAVRVETTENLPLLFILWVSMESSVPSNDTFKEKSETNSALVVREGRELG